MFGTRFVITLPLSLEPFNARKFRPRNNSTSWESLSMRAFASGVVPSGPLISNGLRRWVEDRTAKKMGGLNRPC